MNLPKRELLLFRTVQALPKASRIGLLARIRSSICEWVPLMVAKYCKMILVDSVFPAPDSPLIH